MQRNGHNSGLRAPAGCARTSAGAQLRGFWAGWLAWAALWVVPGMAHAHSAPGVASILDEDERGVQMLRLYQGIVQRDGDAWRFVCSMRYGGVGQDRAASLPSGGVAIAIAHGLALMQRDGTVIPHPDPEGAVGIVTAFARAPGKLYALRMRPQQLVSDVIEITDTAVRVVWTDTRFWSDIAIAETGLVLVHFEQDKVEELRLSFAGEVTSQQAADLVDSLEVSVRVLGDVPYFTAKLETSSLIGRIEDGVWKTIVMAGNNIAGPVALADGTVLVAPDGVLSTLVGDVVTPLSDADFVIGLDEMDGHAYACTRTGLRDISSTGFGASLFDLSELLGPNECWVPEDLRNDCEIEWQHLQVEIIGANIPIASEDASEPPICPTEGAAGAGGTPATAVAGAGAAGSTAQAAGAPAVMGGAGLADAGPIMTSNVAQAQTEQGQAAEATPQRSAAGCACGIPRRGRGRSAGVGLALLAASLLHRRTRRKRRA